MMRRTLLLIALIGAALAAQAQQAMDFAQKFLTTCEGDTMVKCITVSPKMMEQIAERHEGGNEKNEALRQAIAKLKSMRIVSAPASYYERAEELVQKHKRRFKAEREFQGDGMRGAFYTRQSRKSVTNELIMLREDTERETLTIVCLTGDIDKEFLCFLYNNKSLKD